MPERKPVTAIVEKQIQRTAAAIDDFVAGVDRVSEAPTAKAAKMGEKAIARFTEAWRSGKTAKRLQAVSLEDWQAKTRSKSDRFASGITQAADKLTKFHTQRAAKQISIDRELASIPSNTLADSIRRATIQIQKMAEFTFDPTV